MLKRMLGVSIPYERERAFQATDQEEQKQETHDECFNSLRTGKSFSRQIELVQPLAHR